MMKKTLLISLLALTGIAKAQWSLTGNTGTTPGTNFIGTTDAKDLVFKANNQERMRIYSNGNIDFSLGNQYTYPPMFHSKYRFSGGALFSIGENTKEFAIYSNPQDATLFRVDGENVNVYLQEDFGNVIIGSKTLGNCATCNGYKLFVKDGIRTEKVKVDVATTAGWADYVFAKDYKLMPLQEVKNYIDQNHHLPEVPSAEEVVANGVELKEMTTLLLKKIEELTLYTIDQQKQIDELRKLVTNPKK